VYFYKKRKRGMLGYIFISILGISLAIWLQFLLRWVVNLLLGHKREDGLQPHSKQDEDTVLLVYKDKSKNGPVIKNTSATDTLEKAI
jgi:hypothetical protein